MTAANEMAAGPNQRWVLRGLALIRLSDGEGSNKRAKYRKGFSPDTASNLGFHPLAAARELKRETVLVKFPEQQSQSVVSCGLLQPR